MEWYYVEDGARRGPLSPEDFRAALNEGTIKQDTLVWNPDMADWQPFAHVAPAFLAPSTQAADAPLFCVECRLAKRPSEVISFANVHVCGDCKEAYFQRLSQGGIRPAGLPYAGFWVRAGAKILDGLLIAGVGYVLYAIGFYILFLFVEPDPIYTMALTFSLNGVQFFLGLAYATWFVGRFQATPGKMVCGLRIVMPEGQRVSYARALGRAASEIVSAMILYIGYLMVIWDDEKRALHDQMCNTRVIRE